MLSALLRRRACPRTEQREGSEWAVAPSSLRRRACPEGLSHRRRSRTGRNPVLLEARARNLSEVEGKVEGQSKGQSEGSGTRAVEERH